MRKFRTQLSMILLIPITAGSLCAAPDPMGTAFNYQGYLTDKNNNNPLNGQYDIQFELYNASTGGQKFGPTVTHAPIQVNKGLFSTNIDFGPVFDGKAYWLQIGVRPAGSQNNYDLQSPRQQIRPVPNALFAHTASNTAPDSVSGTSIQNNSITANKIANGQVVKSLNGLRDNVSLLEGANITLTPNGNNNTLTIAASGGGGSAGWSLTGNAGTAPGSNFLGTTDNQPLQLHVNGARGLRLEWGTDGGFLPSYGVNVLSGFWDNTIDSGVLGATISGGGGGWYFGNTANRISANYATIGGGDWNSIGSGAVYGTIPGGYNNVLYGGAAYSFVAGKLARALHAGCFVWSDSTTFIGSISSDTFESERPNEFAVRAAGGVRLQTPLLDVRGDFVTVNGAGGEKAYLGGDGGGGDVQIGSLNPAISGVACYNAANGTYMNLYAGNITGTGQGWFSGQLSCPTLEIRGGMDVAEPFEMSEPEIPKGSVVVIDEQNPGQLKMSDQPYDTRVAGIVSGAGGINPGLSLRQEGKLDGGQNVALNGRVYVLADAENSAIKPGDLLTTSSTPGHAMKVTEHLRAQGAILGKAMSGLQEGKGLVLVLVTLQ